MNLEMSFVGVSHAQLLRFLNYLTLCFELFSNFFIVLVLVFPSFTFLNPKLNIEHGYTPPPPPRHTSNKKNEKEEGGRQPIWLLVLTSMSRELNPGQPRNKASSWSEDNLNLDHQIPRLTKMLTT